MSDEIRVGDEFEIRVKVTNVWDHHLVVAPVGDTTGECNIVSSAVLLAGRRIPRPIAVGDRVTVKKPPFTPPPKGKVEWADGIDALVRWFDGSSGLQVETLSDLTPIPGDEP